MKHAYFVTNKVFKNVFLLLKMKGIVVCRTGLHSPFHESVKREGFHHAVKLSWEQMFPAQFYMNFATGDGRVTVCQLESSLSLYMYVDREVRTLYRLASEACMLKKCQV